MALFDGFNMKRPPFQKRQLGREPGKCWGYTSDPNAKQELETYPNAKLAGLCQKVARDAATYTEQLAVVARELFQEYSAFATMAPISPKEEENKKAKVLSWRERSVEFLFQIGLTLG
jgi:hypothetical protein